MNNPREPAGASDLRVQIAVMRRQISDTRHNYESAKSHASPEQLSQLLRQKSQLTRKLLETQRELLKSFQAEVRERV